MIANSEKGNKKDEIDLREYWKFPSKLKNQKKIQKMGKKIKRDTFNIAGEGISFQFHRLFELQIGD